MEIRSLATFFLIIGSQEIFFKIQSGQSEFFLIKSTLLDFVMINLSKKKDNLKYYFNLYQ